MYGLVLMAAMAGGADTAAYDMPAAAVGGGSYGGGVIVAGCMGSSCSGYTSCSGCSGYTSCSGCNGYTSCSGCNGYTSCSGCSGSRSGIFPLFPRLRARLSGMGCRGNSCNGSSCSGYVASCHGSACYGSSCHGNACYGSSCHGTATYYGSNYHGVPSVGGCAGIIVGSTAPAYGSTPVAVAGAPVMEFEVAAAKPSAEPARLTVELPEDAKLYVDGNLTKGNGASRNFHTPELAKGSSYFYELKAEIVVNGETVVEEKRLVVRAGDTLSESFSKLFAAAKAKKDADLVTASK